MKRTIRKGVFETNSSSVHSLVFLSEEEMKKVRNNSAFVDFWAERLVTKEMIEKDGIEVYIPDVCYHLLDRDGFMEKSADEQMKEIIDYLYSRELEQASYKHVTKSGETIYAYCEFGYSG